MAALAYLLLPVSGLIAYALGSSPRLRFHGLQSIAFGAAWPAALFLASWLSDRAAQVVFGVGVVIWLVLVVTAAAGRDVSLPGLGRVLRRAAGAPPGG